LCARTLFVFERACEQAWKQEKYVVMTCAFIQ